MGSLVFEHNGEEQGFYEHFFQTVPKDLVTCEILVDDNTLLITLIKKLQTADTMSVSKTISTKHPNNYKGINL